MGMTKDECIEAARDTSVTKFVGEIDNFIVDKCIELRGLVGSRDENLFCSVMCTMVAGNMSTKVSMSNTVEDNEALEGFSEHHKKVMTTIINNKLSENSFKNEDLLEFIKEMMEKFKK